MMCNNVLKQVMRRSLASRRLLCRSSTIHRKEESEEDLSKPYKYMGSKAEEWKAESTLQPPDAYEKYGWPKYQPLVVCTSLLVFCIYFFILREENDLDELIYKGVPEMSINPLKAKISIKMTLGKDYSAEQKELEKLELEIQQKSYRN